MLRITYSTVRAKKNSGIAPYTDPGVVLSPAEYIQNETEMQLNCINTFVDGLMGKNGFGFL